MYLSMFNPPLPQRGVFNSKLTEIYSLNYLQIFIRIKKINFEKFK